LKIIEKAQAKKEERDKQYSNAVKDNARLRNEIARCNILNSKMGNRIEELEVFQEKYSKLIDWSITAENKIEELTKALEEMYD